MHTFFGKLPKAISLGKSRLSLRSNATRRQANITKKDPTGAFSRQGQKDLVSPAGSLGASALRAEVSTGDPHPSTRSAPDIQCLSKQKVKSLASLTVKQFALQIVIFDASYQVK